jgi:hypothetical protein
MHRVVRFSLQGLNRIDLPPVQIDKETLVYCDNIPAVYLSKNPIHHHRTNHVELDIHIVRETMQLGHFRVLQILSCQQFADVMTKAPLENSEIPINLKGPCMQKEWCKA